MIGSRRPLDVGAFGWAPVMFIGWLAWFVSGHGGAGDYEIFRHAGDAVLHGRTPYVEPTAANLASNDRYVYPTPFAYVFAPFALLPVHAGAVVFLACSAAAVVAGLWLLEVEDWRCYGAAFLGAPVFGALGVGAVGCLLFLLVAASWRLRGTAWAGPMVAVAAAAKLFLWPLPVWLVVTRRLRAGAAAAVTLALLTVAWVVVDRRGLAWYPSTVWHLDEVERWKSYSPQTFAISAGASARLADLVAPVLAAGTVVVVAVLRRRDRDAFLVAVVGALLATPILWLHYLVLLLVPVALARPTLSWAWALPALLWVTPHPESLGSEWKILVALATVAAVAAVVWGREKSPAPRVAGRGSDQDVEGDRQLAAALE